MKVTATATRRGGHPGGGQPLRWTFLAHPFPRVVTGTSVLKVRSIAQIALSRLFQRLAPRSGNGPLETTENATLC